MLTDHQLLSAEQAVGRHIMAELQRIANENYKATTLRAIMRTLTQMLGNQEAPKSPLQTEGKDFG